MAIVNIGSQTGHDALARDESAGFSCDSRSGQTVGPEDPRCNNRLEEQIDECLSLAKYLGRKELASVIGLLRKARNAVVWKLGEPADR